MEDYLVHHGILGQKWGVRRYQNKDGTLTQEGKNRLGNNNSEKRSVTLTDKQKKIIKYGAIAAGTTLAVYGTYKLSKYINSNNVKLASHVGTEFGNKFTEYHRPKAPIGTGGMAQNRYAVGQTTARKAGDIFAEKVSNNIASAKGVNKIKNSINADAIKKGKKTVDDIFNFNDFDKMIISQEKVLSGGQSEFAKLMRDTYGMGGH